MVSAAGIISRPPWQALLRTTARTRARNGRLNRQARWTSDEEQARAHLPPAAHADSSRKIASKTPDQSKHLIRCISLESVVESKEPVKLVGTEPECLCSWNEANGPRQSIHVPGESLHVLGSRNPQPAPVKADYDAKGDASRPRATSIPLAKDSAHKYLQPPTAGPYSSVSGQWRGLRSASWDDPLAALCAMRPDMKLNDVDVMISEAMLLFLIGFARHYPRASSRPSHELSFHMSLVDNTLVIQRRENNPLRAMTVPSSIPPDWQYYEMATAPVPDVEFSSLHHQLLRYNIGSLSCVVRTRVSGTIQDMPAFREPCGPQQTREIHGINVITAGQGVLTPAAFLGTARRSLVEISAWKKNEMRRLRIWTPRLWLSGQTRLGIADVPRPGEDFGRGRLTVVDMGELVAEFEQDNQQALRRLEGVLNDLRDAVRAHGKQCDAVVYSHPSEVRDDNIYIYSGSKESPLLLDWHKKHFWSQDKDVNETLPARDEAINGRVQPRQSLTRRLGQWLGF